MADDLRSFGRDGKSGIQWRRDVSCRGEVSAFDEEIGKCLVRACASGRPAGRGLLVTVIEDLADEIGVGDVFDDAELATAERAEGDVDVEDPFQSLCPGERCGCRFGGAVCWQMIQCCVVCFAFESTGFVCGWNDV